MSKIWRALAAAALLAGHLPGAVAAQGMDDDPMEMMSASDLRVTLNGLLAEHVQLGAAATGAALAGRTDEFQAAADALDGNSVALSGAIGMVYGADAETAFLALWRTHIGFIVEYTQGIAAMDEGRSQQARRDLTGYARDFAAFLSSANPHLPREAVTELVREHARAFTTLIDAQSEKDQAKAYHALRQAVDHMRSIADPLADAIAMQFPERFAG